MIDKYIEIYGDISPQVFNFLSVKMDTFIRYLTFNRDLDPVLREQCLLELIYTAERNKKFADELKKTVKSETVGQHTKSYGNMETIYRDYFNKEEVELYKVVKKYFGHTGVMYRGR